MNPLKNFTFSLEKGRTADGAIRPFLFNSSLTKGDKGIKEAGFFDSFHDFGNCQIIPKLKPKKIEYGLNRTMEVWDMVKKKLRYVLVLFLSLIFAGNVWAENESSISCTEVANAGVVSVDLTASKGANGPGHDNPAAFYCVYLGYEIRMINVEDNGVHGECIFPDGSSCDVWEFLNGMCGVDFSYCAENGYDLIIKEDGKDPFTESYAVCTDPVSGEEIGSITELMDLRSRYERSIHFTDTKPPSILTSPTPSPGFQTKETQLETLAVPASFNWRNKDGQDWMTPVGDQAQCGACWDFSAVGTVEAVYNVDNNNSSLDLDLSEEYLNSDCSGAGSCCGGWHNSALDYIKNTGIPDEACLPWDVTYYQSGACSCYPDPTCNAACNGLPGSCSNNNCSDRCLDFASRLVTIDDYGKVPNDKDQIKDNLVNKGPLSVCLAMSGTYDPAGVYRCTTCWDRDGDSICDVTGQCLPVGSVNRCGGNPGGRKCTVDADCNEDRNGDNVCDQNNDCGINHCVVLVGYNDSGGYWIAKNSWGATWNTDGYWQVGYDECRIQEEVYWVEAPDINDPPICDANGPYAGECQGATTTVQLDGTGSSDPDPGDTLTYSWATDCPGGSFDDPTSSTPILSVDTAPGCLVDCSVTLTVTDDGGLWNTDSATVTISDTTTPSVGCPADTTIECDESTDPGNTGNAIATDNCDSSPALTYSDTITSGTCAEEYAIIRTWKATDSCGLSDTCMQTVNIVDNTPPEIQCNAPATITPPDAPISFTATATDNCDGDPIAEITGYDCFKFTKKGKRIDKTESCVVNVLGNTITIINSGGVGDNISWTTRVADGCGNVTEHECTVEVVKPEKPGKP